MSMQAETKEAIAALEEAIVTLKSGTKLLQTGSALQATSAVQSVLDKLPSDAQLNGKTMSFLSEFIANGAAGKYAPQSATIQGMLSDMYETFAANLEDATMAESKQNQNYEKLTATLEQESNDLNKIKSRKEEQKADSESDLADTTSTYDDTTDQMKADIRFFDQTKGACGTKHSEWTLRQKLRDEELKGIETALGFLSSDKARELFAKSIKPGVEAASFLQTDNAQADDAQAVSFRAYGMLKAQATKSNSFRLASLAVLVRTTKVGHFDAVIKAIDGMIATLGDEGASDRAKKVQCNKEYQKIARHVQDKDWKIKNNDATINKFEQLIQLRKSERRVAIDQISDTNEYMKKITADRKQEHAEFQKAKKDDQDAIALLSTAKEALTAYYKKNSIKMGAVQGLRLVQAAPETPELNFSGKGSNNKQSKGIVSLMTYIIQDLVDEVSNGAKSEAQNQADYEGETKTAKHLLKDLVSKKANLEGIIAKRNAAKTEEHRDMTTNQKERNAELSYKGKITPDCDWIKKNFNGRATARDAEMGGLVSAKEFLAGKAALLQLKRGLLSSH